MKVTEICESTTAGSVATVAAPMNGGPLKRSAVGKGVYGKEPAGSLFTGKKTSKPFANSKLNEEGGFPGERVTVIYVDGNPYTTYSNPVKADKDLKVLRKKYPNKKIEHKQEVREAGMPAAVIKHKQKLAGMTDAELAEHLKEKSDEELKQMAWRHGYGKMSPHYVNRVNKGKKINESELQETDLIIVPGQGRRLKSGFIPHAEDRRDHEVEMARSDLHQAHKNSSKIHKLIKNVSEDEGLEGWVQAKITKAADYLNSVCQYLEGKQLQEMPGGVIAGGGVGEGLSEMFGMKARAEERMVLAHSKNPKDRIMAVTHPSSGFGGRLHKEVCNLLVNDPDPSVRLAVARHGEFSHVRALTKDADPRVARTAATVLNQVSRPGPLGLGEAADTVEEGADLDHLEEGMGLKQLAAAAAALGYMLVPNSLGNGERSTADSAYDSYLSQTEPNMRPSWTAPKRPK